MKVILEIEGKRVILEDKLKLSLKCLPEKIENEKFYEFSVDGWSIFPFKKPILLFSKGNNIPLASIKITEQTAYLLAGEISTKGKYYVRNTTKR